MKKPRKEMRMNRRKMKAEINYLRYLEKRMHAETKQIETLRTEKVINIFDAGSNEFAGVIQREMIQEICNVLVERGYITFRTREDPISCGLRLTASIRVVRQ